MFYADIIKKFNDADIKYAIVGGVAVNLHGHIRMTADLDMIIQMDDENILKTISILKNAGFICKIPVDPIGLADESKRQDWINNKNLKAINFYRGLDEVDLIVDSPVSYEKAVKIIYEIKKVCYPIISMEDLINMKSGTGRVTDEKDIQKLKMLIKIKAKDKSKN